MNNTKSPYLSQSARDAQESGYGAESYWDYLEKHALELKAYYLKRGDVVSAERMLTENLSDALRGNEGN